MFDDFKKWVDEIKDEFDHREAQYLYDKFQREYGFELETMRRLEKLNERLTLIEDAVRLKT